MSDYILTVGLEVHAELTTETKMFCNSKNDPDEKRPNMNICPVCMGYPGTLPVINKEAVRQVLRFGTAVGGKLADYSEFDRKNYFYPDIPKGYQISQYKFPLVTGGEINGVRLTRVHLEEDTAKSTHDVSDASLIDFNRAGVPLMELVTEPVIRSAKEAADFARELQLILIYLGASHANMEKGEMRVEANISVSRDPNIFGTKVEVKNLNSFKAVEKAIAFEMDRHISLLERGEKVIQETRGWGEHKEETFSQRLKEESHDYRYFPDPDLPKLLISEIPEFSRDALRASLPELPREKRIRLKAFDIKDESVEIFVREPEWGRFFEEVVKDHSALTSVAANYITTDVASILKQSDQTPFDTKLSVKEFQNLMKMIQDAEISSRGAKDILKILLTKGGEARTIAEQLQLFQKSNTKELKKIAEEIIAENNSVVTDFKNGNTASLQFLIGQGMKKTKGSANPIALRHILETLLKN